MVRKSKKGFTLIEMITVIAILCILMGAISYGMTRSLDKAHEASDDVNSQAAEVVSAANSQEASLTALGFGMGN